MLGYRGASDGGAWTLSHQRHVEVEGEFADAVPGRFAADQPPRSTVAVEVKGPKDPLDRPFGGRRLSAVDQAYRYAINLPCDWLIVTSMRQIRLHAKAADQHSYERFDTEAVARDEAELQRFVFLLGADRVVPETGPCHLTGLLAESERVGRELTRTFYDAYAGMRRDILRRLAADNPGVPRAALVGCTQRMLDRVLFCAFCEDRGLLPADTLEKAYEHADPHHPRPIWENFRGLFAAVNRGNAALGIHAYNGGLFADTDPVFEALVVADEVCRHFRDLGSYDYRDAAAPLGETDRSLIDVDILGHIFELSIADLEKLRDDACPGLSPRPRKRPAAGRARACSTRRPSSPAPSSSRPWGAWWPPGSGPCGRSGKRRPRRPSPSRTCIGSTPSSRRPGRRSSISGRPGRTSWRRCGCSIRPAGRGRS